MWEISFKRYRNRCTYLWSKRKKHILDRDWKCMWCWSLENLQLDHIISVYRCYKDNIDVNETNNDSNLQILCKSCNCRKLP